MKGEKLGKETGTGMTDNGQGGKGEK